MKEGLEKDRKKLENFTVKDGETNSETGKKKGKEERPPTKVVVRRLPPSMTEEEFLQQIEPLPPVDYMYYVPADLSLAPHSFCRAYLNFVNQSDIFIFTQKFDGYVFVDSKGLEYPAVVEFAPFQRIPKQRPGRKKDPKSGTLESDPAYLSFLEKLQVQSQENNAAGSTIKQHFFETNVSTNDENKVSTTPLLDFLRTRHAERLRAREEKRKKDLERKRARDEQRRSAKKTDDEPSVLKVLPSHTNNTKDKFKEKDIVKPIKKRNDERIKDSKGRIGKSYAEERQKQIEKREEQRKKFMSTTYIKSSKSTKLFTDQKSNELNSEESNKNQDCSESSKKTESDTKTVDNDAKKDSCSEKKNYPQKHYDHSKRDDDVKKRTRDGDRISKAKEHYHERREERYNMRKKMASDNKKSYNRYDDYKDKYKKEHCSFRKEGINRNSSEKKTVNEVKTATVTCDSANKDDITCKTKQKEAASESMVKQIDSSAAENIDDSVSSNSSNLILDSDLSKETDNLIDAEATCDVSVDLDKKDESSTVDETEISLQSSEKNLVSLNDNGSKSDGKDSLVKPDSTDNNAIPQNSCGNVDSENPENISLKVEETDDNIALAPVNETDSSCDAKEEDKVAKVMSESERLDDSSFVFKQESQKTGEILLKRRNSMEMYGRKVEKNDENNCRENVRRSSLESGDQHTNCRELEEEKNDKKKSDSGSTDLKPKDPRTERRIRNKDRPSIEIYRPGMGRFSKQRMEREKVLGSSTEVDSNSPSPSPTLVPKHKSSFVNHNRDSQ